MLRQPGKVRTALFPPQHQAPKDTSQPPWHTAVQRFDRQFHRYFPECWLARAILNNLSRNPPRRSFWRYRRSKQRRPGKAPVWKSFLILFPPSQTILPCALLLSPPLLFATHWLPFPSHFPDQG